LLTRQDVLNLAMRRGGGRGGPRVTETTRRQLDVPLERFLGEEGAGRLRGQVTETTTNLAEAMDQLSAARAEAATTMADTMRQANEQVAQLDVENQERQQRMRGRLERQGQQLRELGEEVSNLSVDAGRYMAERGTATRILQGIGLFLGGLGQGLIGGENPAMRQIEAAIDRDLEAQKVNVRSRRAGFEQQMNLYQTNLNILQDADAATAATRAQLLARSQAQVAQIAAAAQSEDILKRADLAQAELEARRVAAMQEAAQAAAGTVQVEEQRRRGGGGRDPLQRLALAARTAKDLSEAGFLGGGAPGDVAIPGTRQISLHESVTSNENLGHAREVVGALQGLEGTVTEYRDAVSTLSGPGRFLVTQMIRTPPGENENVISTARRTVLENIGGADAVRAVQLGSLLAARQARINNGGRVSDPDVRQAYLQIPMPTNPDFDDVAERFTNDARRTGRAKLRARGFELEPGVEARPSSFQAE
jgi:hypothetical protein